MILSTGSHFDKRTAWSLIHFWNMLILIFSQFTNFGKHPLVKPPWLMGGPAIELLEKWTYFTTEVAWIITSKFRQCSKKVYFPSSSIALLVLSYLVTTLALYDQDNGYLTVVLNVLDGSDVCSFKTRKSQGSPLSWNSSQLINWAHKCLNRFKSLSTSKRSIYGLHGSGENWGKGTWTFIVSVEEIWWLASSWRQLEWSKLQMVFICYCYIFKRMFHKIHRSPCVQLPITYLFTIYIVWRIFIKLLLFQAFFLIK